MKPRTVFVLLLSFVLSSVASVRDPIVDDVLAAMNQSIDPCQDFYGYSCGGWISGTKLPSDKSRYDRSFSIIEQHNQDILRSIVQSPNGNKKLSQFFSSCLDVDVINAQGFAPAQTWLTFVEEAQDPTKLMLVTGALHSIGVGALFGIYVTIDAKNPAINIGGFAQGGLALPYTDLYLDNSTSSVTIRQQYVQHVSNMFQLLGDDSDTADEEAQMVLDFETMIAQFTVPPDQLVDPFTTYNKLNISGLALISPNLDWTSYLEGLGVNFTQATVDVPPFFSNLSVLVGNTMGNTSYWTVYLRWQVIHAFANYLSQPFVDENFAFFGKILRGQKEQSPRWETCIQYTDSALGELLGNYFVQKAFSGESRMLATQILKGIEEAMKTDLTNLDWMDPVTRKRALTKLSKVSNMIGAPTNPKNYSQVVVDLDDFFGNVMEGNVYGIFSQLSQIEKPSDKSQWGMTSPTVNAYYDPTRNQMVFPAGILQQPFFNASFPQAMNAGGIGMVMGHELTHGFDNQGRDYDGDGVLENWWEPATSDQFNKKVQCVIQQYSGFEVLPGVYINGQLTQGENIADMGGIKNSYSSFLTLIGPDANSPSIVPGLSNIQLFFVSFAQGWCEKVTDEYLRVQVQTDPHSPAKFRVLGPLINLPQFSQTFQCKSGSPMNPTNRCEVW